MAAFEPEKCGTDYKDPGRQCSDSCFEFPDLMVELIAWDDEKQLFNFYELIGMGDDASQWYYRGDLRDAWLDNRYLHRQPEAGQPKFGGRMRCSACHVSGAPIMKELDEPHNDWWRSSRPLPLAPNHPSAGVQHMLQDLRDASQLAALVRESTRVLFASPSYIAFKATLSMQEQLRPLFCASEFKLIADSRAGRR